MRCVALRFGRTQQNFERRESGSDYRVGLLYRHRTALLFFSYLNGAECYRNADKRERHASDGTLETKAASVL